MPSAEGLLGRVVDGPQGLDFVHPGETLPLGTTVLAVANWDRVLIYSRREDVMAVLKAVNGL